MANYMYCVHLHLTKYRVDDFHVNDFRVDDFCVWMLGEPYFFSADHFVF